MFRPVIRASRRAPTDGLGIDVIRFLNDLQLTNVFNPSIAVRQHRAHVAFRAFGPSGVKPFHAYYATLSPMGASVVVDLSEHAAAVAGVQVVADPKLFTTSEGVFVTFNTGTPLDGENQVFIMRVSETLGVPQECGMTGRQRIEKNWAFFESHGQLHAVYSLNPLTIMTAVDSSAHKIDFVHIQRHRAPVSMSIASARKLALGTQPVPVGAHSLHMIAHEKVWVRGRRAYFGRLCSIHDIGRASVYCTVSPTRLVHRLRDVAPVRLTEYANQNLLSATYFAGLTRSGTKTLASYGVNDIGFGVTELREDLWPA